MCFSITFGRALQASFQGAGLQQRSCESTSLSDSWWLNAMKMHYPNSIRNGLLSAVLLMVIGEIAASADMMGGGMMRGGMMGSMPRHHFAMMRGIPVPYNSMKNPLPRTGKTIEQGAAVYAQNCSACHGASGAGDGAAAQALSPRPANLALLSQMPMAQWDSFMYWAISEGGAQFGTAMPAFKGSLSDHDRWAVIAYIQARLPHKGR